MKKHIFILAILFSVANFLFAQENKTLVLVHPTAYNLKLFTNLIDKHIVEIDNLKIIGVYHSKENYDYSESERFIKENELSFIELKKVNGVIMPDQLYDNNDLSSVYNDLFEKSKGIFFLGGPDLPPAIYGEPMSLLTRMTDPYRHYFEASFLFHLLGGYQDERFEPLLNANPNYVVYGICLGMQTINIATGGTMIQDIPSEIYNQKNVENVLASEQNMQHRNYTNNLTIDSTLFSGSFHQIKILDNKIISGSKNNSLEPLVYSNHHQSIKKLGKGLEIIATSTDGKVIEAIKHKNYPNVLGLQFHPEGIYLHNTELKYRKNPTGKPKSGLDILKESNSYEFHLQLWKEFSRKINTY